MRDAPHDATPEAAPPESKVTALAREALGALARAQAELATARREAAEQRAKVAQLEAELARRDAQSAAAAQLALMHTLPPRTPVPTPSAATATSQPPVGTTVPTLGPSPGQLPQWARQQLEMHAVWVQHQLLMWTQAQQQPPAAQQQPPVAQQQAQQE